MNENCDVDVAIDRAGYQSWKRQQTTTLQVFFVLFTRPASPSGIYGSLPLPLVLLTKTAKKKTLFRGSFAGIHVSSRGIAGFTDQRTAFTRAQSAILPDFNLRVERAKNPLFTKLISQKRIRWPYVFNAKTYSTARAECMCEIKKKTAE